MLVLLSPSKTLDFEPAALELHTQPDFLERTEELVSVLRDFTDVELGALMKISDKLSALNHERYQDFHTPFSIDNAKQALLAFRGDVYRGFELDTYTEEDFEFAQRHVRILSGLYGVLRPLDLIQPYRLEMGTRLETERGKNLYEFWGETLSRRLTEALDEHEDSVIVNLASNEYFKSVDRDALDARIITPVFREKKKDKYKIVAIYAKRARGLMTDYLVKERITDPEELKKFAREGYEFHPGSSTDDEWVFRRDQS